MLNKMGASSHLEVIISFILFSLFVLSLLFYVNPFKNTTLPDTLIENIYESFIRDNSVELTKFFLDINSPESCMDVTLPSIFDLNDVNSRVFDSNGNPAGSSIVAGLVIDSSNNPFYVFLSSDFLPGTGCDSPSPIDCDAGECSIGSVEKREIVSESKVLSIVEEYKNNYEVLKTQLGIPKNVDFAIVSEGFEMEMYIPEDLEVISKSYSIEVLYSTGEILNKDFIFKIW